MEQQIQGGKWLSVAGPLPSGAHFELVVGAQPTPSDLAILRKYFGVFAEMLETRLAPEVTPARAAREEVR